MSPAMTVARERTAETTSVRTAPTPVLLEQRTPPAERVAPADTTTLDLVDQWGLDSFPASDPPANW